MKLIPILITVLVVVVGCNSTGAVTNDGADAVPAPNESLDKPWTPDQARNLSAESAKAIVVARAAIEARNKPTDWRWELRFLPERTVDGWTVTVMYIEHQDKDGKDISMLEPYGIQVVMDANYKIRRILRGC